MGYYLLPCIYSEIVLVEERSSAVVKLYNLAFLPRIELHYRLQFYLPCLLDLCTVFYKWLLVVKQHKVPPSQNVLSPK